jgi:hypothetical protein
MRSLDAKLTIGVDEVLSGRDHIGRGTLIASLQDGRFSVDPLLLDLPGGAVDVGFALEPSERDVSLDMSAKVEKLDYGILARRVDPKSQTGGLISVDLDLKTRGPDLNRVMSGANGHLDCGLWPEDLNAGIFELWAVNVIAALMSEVDKDDTSKVNCVIVRFQVDNGLMQERLVHADTTKMHVEGISDSLVCTGEDSLLVHCLRPRRRHGSTQAPRVVLHGKRRDAGRRLQTAVRPEVRPTVSFAVWRMSSTSRASGSRP